jgi:hypothetical protein
MQQNTTMGIYSDGKKAFNIYSIQFEPGIIKTATSLNFPLELDAFGN